MKKTLRITANTLVAAMLALQGLSASGAEIHTAIKDGDIKKVKHLLETDLRGNLHAEGTGG